MPEINKIMYNLMPEINNQMHNLMTEINNRIPELKIERFKIKCLNPNQTV